MAQRRTSVVTLALVAALVFSAGIAPAADAMTAAGEASTSSSLVGAARRNAGLGSLATDARLERIARAQSARMAADGRIEHNADLGRDATAEGVDWGWLGENVGLGPDARMIHDGFMNSPHHREIVLRREANAIGVGATIGDDGRVYITQVYATLRSTAQPAVKPAPKLAEAVKPASKPAGKAVAPRTVHAASTKLVPAPPPAKPKVRPPSPDPNVVTGGVVPHGVFEGSSGRSGSTTRSDLRAS